MSEAMMAAAEITGWGTKSGSGTKRSSRQMPTPQQQTGDAADESDDGGFGQELAADVDGGGAQGFADTDLAGALGDGDQHDVHDADAAERERQQRDGAEEEGHDARRCAP